MEKLKAVAEVAHEETFGVSTKVATSQAEQPKPRITMPTRLLIATIIGFATSAGAEVHRVIVKRLERNLSQDISSKSNHRDTVVPGTRSCKSWSA